MFRYATLLWLTFSGMTSGAIVQPLHIGESGPSDIFGRSHVWLDVQHSAVEPVDWTWTWQSHELQSTGGGTVAVPNGPEIAFQWDDIHVADVGQSIVLDASTAAGYGFDWNALSESVAAQVCCAALPIVTYDAVSNLSTSTIAHELNRPRWATQAILNSVEFRVNRFAYQSSGLMGHGGTTLEIMTTINITATVPEPCSWLFVLCALCYHTPNLRRR